MGLLYCSSCCDPLDLPAAGTGSAAQASFPDAYSFWAMELIPKDAGALLRTDTEEAEVGILSFSIMSNMSKYWGSPEKAILRLTDDGVAFVSYRGTDDTIVGWKEDFLMSCETVEADKYAVDYLNLIQRNKTGRIRIGGHSKGGHLAIYAAALADPQISERVETVWSHDGPGFNEEFMENEGLARIVPKIRKFIPDTSVIGMLLGNPTEPNIVVSSEKGVMQHAPLSWQILVAAFVPAPGLSDAGQVFDDTFRSWIYSIDTKGRRAFIDDFFTVLEAPGFQTLSEYQKGGLKAIAVSYDRVKHLDQTTQEKIRELFRIFGGEVAEQLKESWPKFSLWEKFQNMRLRDARGAIESEEENTSEEPEGLVEDEAAGD